MMEEIGQLRLTVKDPLFAEWDELLTLYAQMLNPLCWFELREVDQQAAEYKAAVAEWRSEIVKRFGELVR